MSSVDLMRDLEKVAKSSTANTFSDKHIISPAEQIPVTLKANYGAAQPTACAKLSTESPKA